jgi:hypothetical protein
MVPAIIFGVLIIGLFSALVIIQYKYSKNHKDTGKPSTL